MNDLLDLFHLVKSKVPLITIETRDEREAIVLILNLGATLKKPVYGWNIIKGFSLLDKMEILTDPTNLSPRKFYIRFMKNISRDCLC